MEEAEGEEQLLVLVLLLTASELLLGYQVVETLQVGFQALRRLGGHLDARLQDADGELWVGGAGEPKAEIGMRLLYLQLLYELVKLWHPGERQVTVGQEDPVTL